MTTERDAIQVQAYSDADAAFSIAKKIWQGTTDPKPTAEALQSSFATVLIHIQNLRRGMPGAAAHPTAPPAGQPRAAATARPAPAPQPVDVPACPQCGGPMWDNREGKTNPKAPDFKCRDKGCKDAKGMGTALWVRDLKKHAQAATIRDNLDSYAEMPKALQDETSDLPF